MKNNVFMLLIMTAFVSLLATSCLKTDDDPKTYSAAEELALRNAYLDNLASKGHDIDTTASGIYYVVIEEGTGDFAKAKDTLTVGYGGYFIDNVMFDSSEIHFPDGKMTFVLESQPMISGWNEAMKIMNKNARVQFIIPSEKAYGKDGYGSVPPYQTLVFVVKMFDIKPF
jgi:FKBP-type peptidyl-prolyl cis-trans isomerase FkpA